MKRSKWIGAALTAAGCALAFSATAVAQDKPAEKPKTDVKKEAKEAAKPAQDAAKDAAKKAEGAAPAGGMSPEMMAEMMAQMEKLGKPGENHKLLESMVGDWTYVNKFQMDPSMPASESTGVTNYKSLLGGRFFMGEHKGKMQMPGADGKMKDMDFHGIGIAGYDNVKGKFIHTWMDNMGTMIIVAEGTYDAASKTFTYDAEMEMMPGMKQKVREIIKIVDNDKHIFEWHEDRGGKYVKMMEITYSRKK